VSLYSNRNFLTVVQISAQKRISPIIKKFPDKWDVSWCSGFSLIEFKDTVRLANKVKAVKVDNTT
jgi:hypothetical protein